MRHKELLLNLQNLTQKKITQKDIAQALGVNLNRISTRASRNSQYSTEEISELSRKFGVNILQEEYDNMQAINKDFVLADYYPDTFGDCSTGKFIPNENKEKISIPRKMFSSHFTNKQYSLINAFGDSMIPLINNKDKLLIEHTQSNEQIDDSNIYIFRYKKKIFCRRLTDNINCLIMKSDNLQYEPVQIKYENFKNDLELLGKVVGLIRSII